MCNQGTAFSPRGSLTYDNLREKFWWVGLFCKDLLGAEIYPHQHHPFLLDMCRQAEHQSVELSVWLILIYSNMEALCLHKDIP